MTFSHRRGRPSTSPKGIDHDMHVDLERLAWNAYDAIFPLNLLIYVLLWPILEVLFVFRVWRYRRLRSEQPCTHNAADTEEVVQFWYKVIEEPGVEDIITSWFTGEGPCHRGNLLEFIAWTCYAVPLLDLEEAQRAQCETILDALVKAFAPTVVRDGYNPDRKSLRHTLEPLAPCWKPLFFYHAIGILNALGNAVLRVSGFKLRTEGDLSYWFHPGDQQSTSTPPVILVHGVGGLCPFYVPLTLQLRRMRPGAPLLAPLLPHCSLLPPPIEPPPPIDTTRLVAGILGALRAHAPPGTQPRGVFFAHSLGTAVVAQLAKAAPAVVSAVLFVDPVCFLLYRSDIVINFLYRWPRRRHVLRHVTNLHWWFALAVRYVFTLEPTIQSCFRREFWWSRHWLHPSSLRCPAHVVLAGRDAIVPSRLVHEYLRSHEERRGEAAAETRPPMKLDYHRLWHHGWSVLSPFSATRAINLRRLCALIDQVGPPVAAAEVQEDLWRSEPLPPPVRSTRKSKEIISPGEAIPYCGPEDVLQ
jgi:pimeloyl-ACP methyl ester carboxylesterase